jgi:hypothetical protein
MLERDKDGKMPLGYHYGYGTTKANSLQKRNQFMARPTCTWAPRTNKLAIQTSSSEFTVGKFRGTAKKNVAEQIRRNYCSTVSQERNRGIFRAKVVKRLGQNKQQIAMYGAVTAAGGKGKKKETGAGLALSNIVLDTESIPFRLAGESFKKKKESFFF